jgi:hypothetical protein
MLKSGKIGVQDKIRFFFINALSILLKEDLTLINVPIE